MLTSTWHLWYWHQRVSIKGARPIPLGVHWWMKRMSPDYWLGLRALCFLQCFDHFWPPWYPWLGYSDLFTTHGTSQINAVALRTIKTLMWYLDTGELTLLGINVDFSDRHCDPIQVTPKFKFAQIQHNWSFHNTNYYLFYMKLFQQTNLTT